MAEGKLAPTAEQRRFADKSSLARYGAEVVTDEAKFRFKEAGQKYTAMLRRKADAAREAQKPKKPGNFKSQNRYKRR